MHQQDELAQMFATLMAHRRRVRKVTLSGLARDIGLGEGGHSHLSRIERGLLVPSFPLGLVIASALEMDLEALKP